MSTSGITTQDVLVRAQDTPNPYAVKFIVNHALKREGKATFSDASDAAGLPLAETLFAVPGVKQVYFFQNTLTVTHDGTLPADDLKGQVTSIIKTRLPIHDAEFRAPDESQQTRVEKRDRSHLSPEMQQIEEILDRTVRPGLQADGGDIEVISLENDEIRILYQGACGGCPSAMMGTLHAIQNILAHELGNENLRVIPV